MTDIQKQLEICTPEILLNMHKIMVKTRKVEERLIKMFKQGQGYFWIGGPGEEAMNVALGLQINQGQGLDHDYCHLHYRATGTLLAMGMDIVDPFRQMRNTATDKHSGGRNFYGHYSISQSNVAPITSPVSTQFVIAIGTAIAQRQQQSQGITIVAGGDAGTAEGDFASCLVWSSRPDNELPMLMIVNNNQWGISTHASTQHGEKYIADRAKPFGIKTMRVEGNDAEAAYLALHEALNYVREQRRPCLLEANVSRLYGHSSASGAVFNQDEEDCIVSLEEKLLQQQLITADKIKQIHQHYEQACRELVEQVKEEPQPDKSSIYDHIYWQPQDKR